MYTWADMSRVKKELWDKLHQAKSLMKDGVNNLAQVVSTNAQTIQTNIISQLPESVKLQLAQYYQNMISHPVQREQPLMLGQVSSHTDESADDDQKPTEGQMKTMYSRKDKLGDTGVLSTKQMNTRGTLLLYFCIMTVLSCCCLGRCLIVPLSQASNYELNSRKHMGK
jgi:hypothetical protein